ncbi:MAG TPA: hypothetical protein VNA25_01185 [Phycisphaerae bacterium]|nr:hypothetical protein [Phycisphaerae bacterium]
MSKRARRHAKQTRQADRRAAAPTAADGQIPDRSTKPARWKYVLIAVVFLAWLAFLIYCQAAGS